MAQATATTAPPIAPEAFHRLTVEQYDTMARTGILGPGANVELLEGWLVRKMTKTPPHRIATRKTRLALERIVPEGWYVETQEPVVTADSEPEPDVAVIRGRTEDYVAVNSPATAVGLAVEVANVSLARDRAVKGRIYAAARVPTYWIVDTVARKVEVYGEPQGEGADAVYASRSDLGEGERVRFVLDGRQVGESAVADLLP